MGTYREKMKQFLIMKNEVIVEEIGINLITKEDLADIENWDEEICENIWEKIKFTNSYTNLNDCDICPWCHYTKYIYDRSYSRCVSCTYGNRNGICVDDDSLYEQIQNALCKDKECGISDLFNVYPTIKDIMDEIDNDLI
jgi:hypothetical protein